MNRVWQVSPPHPLVLLLAEARGYSVFAAAAGFFSASGPRINGCPDGTIITLTFGASFVAKRYWT